MTLVEMRDVSYAYGRRPVLQGLDLTVPDGAMYALLGANGSGKTTLLQLLMGLRRPRTGQVSVLGTDVRALDLAQRARIAYVAEGQVLPRWMRLEQLEAYVAPLYTTWDGTLARALRERFALDPAQRIGTMSRGQQMKAALLCALAPRPSLLLMDEPFTGMDAVVKDDLVRGLLATAGAEGWTVVVSSHDIAELEMIADSVGLLEGGRMRVSEPLERLQARFRRVSVLGAPEGTAQSLAGDAWLGMDRAGRRVSFVVSNADDAAAMAALRERFAGADAVEVQELSLREIFVALARPAARAERTEAA